MAPSLCYAHAFMQPKPPVRTDAQYQNIPPHQISSNHGHIEFLGLVATNACLSLCLGCGGTHARGSKLLSDQTLQQFWMRSTYIYPSKTRAVMRFACAHVQKLSSGCRVNTWFITDASFSCQSNKYIHHCILDFAAVSRHTFKTPAVRSAPLHQYPSTTANHGRLLVPFRGMRFLSERHVDPSLRRIGLVAPSTSS